MRIMLYSLLWVMQDLYHQPYENQYRHHLPEHCADDVQGLVEVLVHASVSVLRIYSAATFLISNKISPDISIAQTLSPYIRELSPSSLYSINTTRIPASI